MQLTTTERDAIKAAADNLALDSETIEEAISAFHSTRRSGWEEGDEWLAKALENAICRALAHMAVKDRVALEDLLAED